MEMLPHRICSPTCIGTYMHKLLSTCPESRLGHLQHDYSIHTSTLHFHTLLYTYIHFQGVSMYIIPACSIYIYILYILYVYTVCDIIIMHTIIVWGVWRYVNFKGAMQNIRDPGELEQWACAVSNETVDRCTAWVIGNLFSLPQ